MRDKSGRFVKGYSGNTGGRPKDEHNIAELARSYSTEAIETLVNLYLGGYLEKPQHKNRYKFAPRYLKFLYAFTCALLIISKGIKCWGCHRLIRTAQPFQQNYCCNLYLDRDPSPCIQLRKFAFLQTRIFSPL